MLYHYNFNKEIKMNLSTCDFDVFEDESDNDIEQINEFYREIFKVQEIDESLADYHKKVCDQMINFFANKKTHDGLEICQNSLLNSRNINLVKSQNIINSANLIYKAIALDEAFKHLTVKDKKHEVSLDVLLVMDILDMFCTERVPKKMAGGILILYFHYCKGLKIL